jgi:hypothetical protein
MDEEDLDSDNGMKRGHGRDIWDPKRERERERERETRENCHEDRAQKRIFWGGAYE